MAYMQIVKGLQRNLQQTATLYSAQKCKLTQVSLLIHTHRTASTVSRLTFHRRIEAPSVMPVLSCLIRRGISLDSTARSQSSPEERDKSVSRYQSGSPKPSAAQKGKQGSDIRTVDELCPRSSPLNCKIFSKTAPPPPLMQSRLTLKNT